MKEAGLPTYKIDFWYGFFVPAGTPPEIVKKLFEATQVALQKAEVRPRSPAKARRLRLASPADFAAFIREENKFWASWRGIGAKAD
jgi:tripartite-type tricarboxylate transporter receptor subunit TctC